MVEFLIWLLNQTGPTLVVLGVLGFVFREKWKQLLTRSLEQELLRYKHELTLDQQKHAASLTPQLEEVRHKFQRDIEAYKTSLIAQAEEVKLKSDVKKGLAIKYQQIKFDRLIALEQSMSKAATIVANFAGYPIELRDPKQLGEALESAQAYKEAMYLCYMFLEATERQSLVALSVGVADMLKAIGPEKQPIHFSSKAGKEFMGLQIEAESMVRKMIHEMAAV